MAQGKQQPKFETNLCIRFRDNYDTDGRRTNFDFMSSADTVNSGAKKNFFFQKFKKRGLPRGSNNQNLKEFRTSGSEKIAAWADGQNSHTLTSADRVKQS